MESLFNKRKIKFSDKYEPRVNKHIKHENGNSTIAQKEKPRGPASKIRDNLKGR